MSEKYSNTFLERWMNGSLSTKELEEFKNSSEYPLYQKILEKSSELRAPEFENEVVFKKIKDKIHKKKKLNVRPLFSKWMYSAAASVILLLGAYYFLNLSTTHSTGFGEQLSVVLPDNSNVLLNANSRIKFSKSDWSENRTLKLDGEAFFKVKNGSKFEVETNEGIVVVLGTQFNVKSDTDYFEVHCFEGKVQVVRDNNETILTKGKAVRQIEKNTVEQWDFSHKEPSWSTGESSFNSTPLKYVIKALENQYKIKINSSKIDVNDKFTGNFSHSNIEIALQTVFVPMNIEATFVDKKTVLLVNNK